MSVNGNVPFMLQIVSPGTKLSSLPPSGKFWQKYNNRSKFRQQYFSQYPSAHTPRRRGAGDESVASSSGTNTPEAVEGEAQSEASSDQSGPSALRKRQREKGRRTCKKQLDETLAKDLLKSEPFTCLHSLQQMDVRCIGISDILKANIGS